MKPLTTLARRCLQAARRIGWWRILQTLIAILLLIVLVLTADPGAEDRKAVPMLSSGEK